MPKKTFGTHALIGLSSKKATHLLKDEELQTAVNVDFDESGSASPILDTTLAYSVPCTHGLKIVRVDGTDVVFSRGGNDIYIDGVAQNLGVDDEDTIFISDGDNTYALAEGTSLIVDSGGKFRHLGPIDIPEVVDGNDISQDIRTPFDDIAFRQYRIGYLWSNPEREQSDVVEFTDPGPSDQVFPVDDGVLCLAVPSLPFNPNFDYAYKLFPDRDTILNGDGKFRYPYLSDSMPTNLRLRGYVQTVAEGALEEGVNPLKLSFGAEQPPLTNIPDDGIVWIDDMVNHSALNGNKYEIHLHAADEYYLRDIDTGLFIEYIEPETGSPIAVHAYNRWTFKDIDGNVFTNSDLNEEIGHVQIDASGYYIISFANGAVAQRFYDGEVWLKGLTDDAAILNSYTGDTDYVTYRLEQYSSDHNRAYITDLDGVRLVHPTVTSAIAVGGTVTGYIDDIGEITQPIPASGAYRYGVTHEVEMESGDTTESNLIMFGGSEETNIVNIDWTPVEVRISPYNESDSPETAYDWNSGVVDGSYTGDENATLKYNVWRTKLDGSSFFLLDTIEYDGYTDNQYIYDKTPDNELGRAYLGSIGDSSLPDGISFAAECQQRLFIVKSDDKKLLQFSAVADFDSFDELDALDMTDNITVLARIGERLAVFTPDRIATYIPGPVIGQLDWSRSIAGTKSPHSVRPFKGGLLFAQSDGLYHFDGVDSTCVSRQVDKEWEALDGNWQVEVSINKIMCASENGCLSADTEEGWKWTVIDDTVAINHSFAVSTDGADIYLGDGSSIDKMFSGSRKTMTVRTKEWGGWKVWDAVHVQIDALPYSGSFDVAVITDDGTRAEFTITGTTRKLYKSLLPRNIHGTYMSVEVTGNVAVFGIELVVR